MFNIFKKKKKIISVQMRGCMAQTRHDEKIGVITETFKQEVYGSRKPEEFYRCLFDGKEDIIPTSECFPNEDGILEYRY